MSGYETAIFTNMCMVYDDSDHVLVQDRVDPGWPGITFPGGHVEKGESFTDSVLREVWEETGLRISHPQLCGVKQWLTDEGCRYVVLCYKTNHWEGELTSSAEGEMRWVPREELFDLPLASGMEKMFQLFLSDEISEHVLTKVNQEWVNVLK